MVNPESHEQDSAPKEIERKFVVRRLPKNLDKCPHTIIHQGYLEINDDGSERRIRDESGSYTETTKSNGGLVRVEIEKPLSKEQFDALWPATEGKRVEKTRFTIEQYRAPTIELDVYDGHLRGLVVAEVEFPDEASAGAFVQPEWFDEEVTENRGYKNQQLALHGRPEHE